MVSQRLIGVIFAVCIVRELVDGSGTQRSSSAGSGSTGSGSSGSGAPASAGTMVTTGGSSTAVTMSTPGVEFDKKAKELADCLPKLLQKEYPVLKQDAVQKYLGGLYAANQTNANGVLDFQLNNCQLGLNKTQTK